MARQKPDFFHKFIKTKQFSEGLNEEEKKRTLACLVIGGTLHSFRDGLTKNQETIKQWLLETPETDINLKYPNGVVMKPQFKITPTEIFVEALFQLNHQTEDCQKYSSRLLMDVWNSVKKIEDAATNPKFNGRYTSYSNTDHENKMETDVYNWLRSQKGGPDESIKERLKEVTGHLVIDSIIKRKYESKDEVHFIETLVNLVHPELKKEDRWMRTVAIKKALSHADLCLGQIASSSQTSILGLTPRTKIAEFMEANQKEWWFDQFKKGFNPQDIFADKSYQKAYEGKESFVILKEMLTGWFENHTLKTQATQTLEGVSQSTPRKRATL